MRDLIDLVAGTTFAGRSLLAELAAARWSGDARSFGQWLGKLNVEEADKGILNHDYTDDKTGAPLRYRLITTTRYRNFLQQELMPRIIEAGWHLTVQTKRGRNRWQLVFEPTLTTRVSRSGVFWHLTPREQVSAILHDGLQPRASRHGFAYPQPRIYLIRQQSDARHMAASFAHRDAAPVDYALLRVDLRRASGVKLHIDPELRDVAVYTTQPIPASVISVVDS